MAVIVAPQPQAAEIGLEVLRRGGNAVDAAVTCAFAQGVLDPQMCGIGGCGVMLVHDRHGEDVLLEFYATAGSLVRENMWEKLFLREAADRYGYVLDGSVNDVGYQSVGVPRHRAGHADRLVAHVVDRSIEHVAVAVGGLAQEQPLPHVLAHQRAGGRVELEQHVLAVPVVHEHHATAADAAHLRVEHALRERACDRGVDRVAPAAQNLQADLGGLRLRRDDDCHLYDEMLVMMVVLFHFVFVFLAGWNTNTKWKSTTIITSISC